MFKYIFLSTTALLLTACASNQGQPLNTASGNPEIFIERPVEEVQAFLAQNCMATGATLETSTNQITVCVREEANIAKSALLQIAIGNSYSTTPLIKGAVLDN